MAWKVELSDASKMDFRNIIDWTIEHFGERQADSYAAALTAAIDALSAGPRQPAIKPRNDIGDGILSLHVGQRGRHFLVFRVKDAQQRILEVARILHDAMDAPRHLR